MYQQPSENEITKLLEYLKNADQTDVMQQQLFFIQTESIRRQKLSDERIIEALMNIAANSPNFSARREANKTLKYLGITPPPVNPKLRASSTAGDFGRGAMVGGGIVFLTIVISQLAVLGGYWSGFMLIFAVIGSLIFGVPLGGIGGLILAKIKKDDNAAYTGGAIIGVILAPFMFAIFSFCGFLGGC